MAKILSTKTLSKVSFERLIAAGHQISHYDIISAEPLPFAAPRYDMYICSSQNTVTALSHYWKNQDQEHLLNTDWYCVGDKTAEALKKMGLRVVEVAHSAQELIEEKLSSLELEEKRKLWLSGVKKTKETEAYIRSKKADAIDVYLAIPNLKKVSESFDVVLFYSPQGIEYFLKNNSIEEGVKVYCIGDTTAQKAENLNISVTAVAKTPSSERMVLDCILDLKKQ
jgi:uroporphyrinogen-III synthase